MGQPQFWQRRQGRARPQLVSPFGNVPEIFHGVWTQSAMPANYNFFLADKCLGGCCQWVLDAVRQTVEWFHQPLGFDSLALLL
jgi:hypothetical protein